MKQTTGESAVAYSANTFVLWLPFMCQSACAGRGECRRNSVGNFTASG